jgi:signal transduction histidine kinase
VKLFGLLLDNAILHGGVRPLTVRVEAETGPALVTVTVSIDGVPVPAELRPRLFTLLPLGGDGAGPTVPAGMAVARRIVEGHGGVIWCRPADAGTSFSFTLPAGRP